LDIREEETPEAEPTKDYTYVGVSIADTSGEVISSPQIIAKQQINQDKMVSIQNLGRPAGENFKAQSLKTLVNQDLESPELMLLKEKRLKRKANFTKALEERRARNYN
jgi:hypothetical protein